MRTSLTAMLAALAAFAAAPALADPGLSYAPGSLVEAKIHNGPWNLHENTAAANYDASGIIPATTTPPYVGDGFPYQNYCAGGVASVNGGLSLMQPYYFPFVTRRGDQLVGLFDYRPRNEQEASVEAVSDDWGATWRFYNQSLGLNNYCPWDASDPDNQNVSVGGVKTAYGSNSANAADNGQGHPTILSIAGKTYLYTLNRANNHIDSDPLVVHKLEPDERVLTRGLPKLGYVSPLASGGYPTLDAAALATTGLIDPDAIMGSVNFRGAKAVVYVEKQLGADNTGATALPTAQQCPSTPSFALTNLVNKKAKKANHDITSVRIAVTSDGLGFADVGAATGLNDPTTVALNGIRWLGSGSLVPLSDGRYAMFFGAGNCLDNDSDGFHFIGYAETVSPVRRPADLLAWKVINGFDNPILSTDTVTDSSGPRAYPLNPPVVNVTGADALTAAQVAPYAPPTGGYGSNYFSGRVYDPQVTVKDERTLNIVFAGYNTPQPSSNLGDYRTIGRFELKTKPHYFGQPNEFDSFRDHDDRR